MNLIEPTTKGIQQSEQLRTSDEIFSGTNPTVDDALVHEVVLLTHGHKPKRGHVDEWSIYGS